MLEKDQGRPAGGWQQPLVSVDVVALSWRDEQLRFALHERPNEPFAGRSALPGVLLLPGSLYGEAWAKHFRIGFGRADFRQNCERLAGFCQNWNPDRTGSTS